VIADDFGNLEAGTRHLFRFLHTCTQVKSEEAAAVVLSHLGDADMIRAYSAGNPQRDFYHLPRTRTAKSYLVRKCPPSPWCNAGKQLGKHVRSVKNQGLAKNVAVTSQEHNSDVLLGVGVGVGVGEKLKSKTTMSVSASQKPDFASQSREILDYLNHLTGSRFQPKPATLKPIQARLKEGYSMPRLKEVALLMHEKWATNEKMVDYLRPKTLYTATNFANYDGTLPNGVDDDDEVDSSE
jgi:uncharacterized phage protein (TIGR02220 family)